MRHSFLLLLFPIFIGCELKKSKGDGEFDLLSNFNDQASEAYFKNYASSEDFRFMSAFDKCILDKTISSTLDYLNNSITTVVDSFFVRSYFSYELLTHLTFVATKEGKFYFINVPQFQQFHYSDKYYIRKTYTESTYSIRKFFELKDSVGNFIFKLNAPMLDKFVEEQINPNKNFRDQVVQVDNLLNFILKDMLGEFYPYLLNDSIESRPKHQRDEIMRTLAPILSRENLVTTWDRDYKVYSSYLGFTIVYFKKSELDNKKLKLELYFIPFLRRSYFLKDYDGVFIDCQKQFSQ